ncbi:hypothetical protein [Nitrobacter sp. JJSN]|uniref:hypothetical protein n=1 Tax=Nitrobacter sp. JJSN TaxID=3453033 RepID=UPI003F770712
MNRASYAELERLASMAPLKGKSLEVLISCLDDPANSLFGCFGGIGPLLLWRRAIYRFVGWKMKPAAEGGRGPTEDAVRGFIEGAIEFFSEVKTQLESNETGPDQ